MKCLWIATTPRSGSNFFCDLLFEGATIQSPKEVLNLDLLRTRGLFKNARYLVPSLETLIERLGYDRTPPICLKVLYSQFELARGLAGVRESLAAHPVVLLLRRDIVAQAVSLYIAEFTGQWTSFERPVREVAALPYSFEAIDRIADRIERHTALWRRTFLVAGIEYEEIQYEQLNQQPRDVLNGVMQLWNLEPRTGSKPVLKPHSSQTSEVNGRFIEQYRRDKVDAIFEGAPDA